MKKLKHIITLCIASSIIFIYCTINATQDNYLVHDLFISQLSKLEQSVKFKDTSYTNSIAYENTLTLTSSIAYLAFKLESNDQESKICIEDIQFTSTLLKKLSSKLSIVCIDESHYRDDIICLLKWRSKMEYYIKELNIMIYLVVNK